jgi:hypothetical protein
MGVGAVCECPEGLREMGEERGPEVTVGVVRRWVLGVR